MADKLQITPPSRYAATLLELWATSTGRTLSSLCASLLDQALTAAIEQGRVPSAVVAMADEIFEPERQLARLEVEHGRLGDHNSSFTSIQGRIAYLQQAIDTEAATCKTVHPTKGQKATKKEAK